MDNAPASGAGNTGSIPVGGIFFAVPAAKSFPRPKKEKEPGAANPEDYWGKFEDYCLPAGFVWARYVRIEAAKPRCATMCTESPFHSE
jgi:hypothetical protein